MKKIAKEKLKSKNIKWTEAYTDKTAFLKEQYEAVVGPYSYFRFEGVSPDGDEYYCILSPARVHQPIAKWFAGVRKLPATYSAGGKYFDSLDAAASYALETWGVSTPRSLRPYSAAHLRGISGKILKWKAQRELEGKTEPSGKDKKSKYEIKKQSSSNEIVVEAMAKEKLKSNRTPPEFVVNVLNPEDVASFKMAYPKFADILIEGAIDLRNRKIQEFVDSTDAQVDEEVVSQNTETFVVYWSEYGGYTYNVGPYVGKFRGDESQEEMVGVRIGVFGQRYRVLSREFFKNNIDLIIYNPNKAPNLAFKKIFDGMVDEKQMKNFKDFLKGDKVSKIQSVNRELEIRGLSHLELPEINYSFDIEDFVYEADGVEYSLDDEKLYSNHILDSKDANLKLSVEGSLKAKKFAAMYERFRRMLTAIEDGNFEKEYPTVNGLYLVENIDAENVQNNLPLFANAQSFILKNHQFLSAALNTKLMKYIMGRDDLDTDQKVIYTCFAIGAIQNKVRVQKGIISNKKIIEHLENYGISLGKGGVAIDHLKKQREETAISGKDSQTYPTSILGESNKSQLIRNLTKLLLLDAIDEEFQTKRQDFYFNKDQFKKNIIENIINYPDLPPELKNRKIEKFLESNEFEEMYAEVSKELVKRFKGNKITDDVVSKMSGDILEQRKKYESQLGFDTLEDAMVQFEKTELPSIKVGLSSDKISKNNNIARVNTSEKSFAETLKNEYGYGEDYTERDVLTKGLEPHESEYDVSKKNLEDLTDEGLEIEVDKYMSGDTSFYDQLNEDDKAEFGYYIANYTDAKEDVRDSIDLESLSDDQYDEVLNLYKQKDNNILKILTEDQKRELDFVIKLESMEENDKMSAEVPVTPVSPVAPVAQSPLAENKKVQKASLELSKILIKESAVKNMNALKNALEKSGEEKLSKEISNIIKGM